MKHACLSAVLVCSAMISIGCVSHSHPLEDSSRFRHGLSVLVGQRSYHNEESLPGVDTPLCLGLEYDVYRPAEIMGLELGLGVSGGRDKIPSGEFDAHTTMLRLGLRKTFELAPFFPYVAVGSATTFTETELRRSGFKRRHDKDWDTGYYLRIGVSAMPYESLIVGLDVLLLIEDSLDEGGYDLDSHEVSMRVGLRL